MITPTKDSKDADEGKGEGSGEDPGGVGHRVGRDGVSRLPTSCRIGRFSDSQRPEPTVQ